jgi:hypothetical protein
MPEGELFLAFGQADEAGEVGVQDCGKVAARGVRGIHDDRGTKSVGGKTQIEPENPCVTGPYAAQISTRLVSVQMLFRSETILPYAASAAQTLSDARRGGIPLLTGLPRLGAGLSHRMTDRRLDQGPLDFAVRIP